MGTWKALLSRMLLQLDDESLHFLMGNDLVRDFYAALGSVEIHYL